MIDVLSVTEAHVNEEDEAPFGLREFVAHADEAARIARQRAGGWPGHGGRQMRERIVRVADLCAAGGGDMAQIGHSGGRIASGLAAVARKRNCRIVVVDAGASEEERLNFDQALLPWRGEMLKDSREPILWVLPDTASLKDRFHYCFALVGGKDNSFLAYFNDIMAFTSCPVVAVDYCLSLDGPRLAFEVAAVLLGRVPVRDARCREGYLVMP